MAKSHFFRYILASGFIDKTDHVLDAACGCGYGSEILARVAKNVVGLDRDGDALEHAQQFHAADNVVYFKEDLDKLDPAGLTYAFDVSVSFETIEHVQDPATFIKRLKCVTRRAIICSVPIIPTVGINKYHKTDFTYDGFIRGFEDFQWKLYQGVKMDFSHEHGTYGVFVFKHLP
jgi:cyclopropane fatty-acyl-phospholipid synthase-like methyltransferase